MHILLVNSPVGRQELIQVGHGGRYFDLNRVLWDERIDGKFPDEHMNNVGGLIRVGKSLQLDPVLKAAHDQKLKDIEDARIAEAAARDASIQRIKAVGSANSINELKTIVADMAKLLGLI